MTNISTLILGAGVNHLLPYAFDFAEITIIDLHGENDQITLDSDWAVYYKNTGNWIFYTDNLIFRNYEYDDNVVIEWHSLSEWEG